MGKKGQKGARGYRSRSHELREIRQRFLIVCEGKETEPNYFNSFRLPKVVVIGDAGNPRAVVQKAIDRQKKSGKGLTKCGVSLTKMKSRPRYFKKHYS